MDRQERQEIRRVRKLIGALQAELESLGSIVESESLVAGRISLTDGVTPPDATASFAHIYVDIADGDLKVKFGDGIVKTLATDT
jgi:hypothetical protein